MNYKNKKVILIGGSGFIGTQIAKALYRQGAHIVILDPHPTSLDFVTYIKSDLKTLPDFDAIKNPFIVINLAGVPIFGRWNKTYKEKIKTSRIDVTRILVEKFKHSEFRPEYFINTSAIGVFGDREDEILNEHSETKANTYLAQIAYDWEQEALQAEKYGVHVKIVRNAHVLGKGGLLAVMKKIFAWGIGGHLGRGDQYMSFVSIDRCVQTYLQAPFVDSKIIHAVSIEPLTNKEFSKILAHILHRPCLFFIPVFAMRILYGDFAKEIVTSQRVVSLYNTEKEDIKDVLIALVK
jgi:uncharacterized protein (TIGR01777 family)